MKVCDKRNHEIHQIHKSGVLKSLFSCVSCILWFIMICAALSSYAGGVEATSPVFGLSLKHDGVRQSAGAETLTYSSQWDGGAGATVTIAQDGAVVADGLSGEGTQAWSVTRNGTYVLTHTTYTNGIIGKVETATFVVTGKDVSFGADDVRVAGYSGKYDGAAHGVGVMVKDGIDGTTVKYAIGSLGSTSPTGEWSETLPMITDVGSMTVWCEIAAPGYITQTNSATVVISPREVTLTSGSASKVYDGMALVNQNVTVDGDGFVDGEGAIFNITGSQTNVGESENAFTYTLNANTMAGNYNITTVNGTLTVTKANVGGGAGGGEEPGAGEVPQGGVSKFDASFVYDGEGHTIDTNALEAAFGAAMVGGGVVEYAVDDGSGDVPALPWMATAPVYINAGEYIVWYRVTNPNYEDFVHAAKLSITPRPVTVTVVGKTATFIYDKTEKVVEGYDIASGDALYDASAGTVFAGEAKAVRTVVGTTAMGLLPSQFSNVNANFTVTYAVTDGWVKIERSGFDLEDVFGSEGNEENPLVCEKVYNGSAQPVEIRPNFAEEYRFLWSLTNGDESAYSEIAPTLRNVADGELTVYFKFVTENYEPYYGKVIFSIKPKELTDDMVQLTDEAFFYDPNSGQKTPSVTVADTNVIGEVISTAADYDVAYGDSTSAGAIPVTVTAKNNYFGTVTKTFSVLKRPVAPPVIGSLAYNGKSRKANIPVDDRWMVVKNEGGIVVGEYEVVLRLTNPDDYKWKDWGDDESEWTGVFRITKANNGWSRYPGINSWTNGETSSETLMGQARYGTVLVAYRRRGADVATETATKPSLPGKYIARFWVEATENYIGVAVIEPYYEVEFEIFRGAGDVKTHTETTPVPVSLTWLDAYVAKYGNGDYEKAGNAKGANGCALWESYVAGLDPEDATSRFTAKIEMLADGTPKVTWTPDLSNAEAPRKYTTMGKTKLEDANWTEVSAENKAQMKFFKVTVEMK